MINGEIKKIQINLL